MSSHIECPSCKHDDLVQRVKAIYEGQTVRISTTHYSSYSKHDFAESSGDASSRLADLLEPPRKFSLEDLSMYQTDPQPNGLIKYLLWGTWGLIQGSIKGIIVFWIVLIAMLAIPDSPFTIQLGRVNGENQVTLHTWAWAVCLLMTGAFPLWGVSEAIGKLNGENRSAESSYKSLLDAKSRNSQIDKHNNQIPRYLSRWEKSYYCHRCHVVYLPNETTFFDPNCLMDLLKL